MFEGLDELMGMRITKEDRDRGLYFSTALSGFYLEMMYDDDEIMTIVYETASFPSDGYIPSVKRIVGTVCHQNHGDIILKDIVVDMVNDGKVKYIPARRLEDWEAKALKDAVMI